MPYRIRACFAFCCAALFFSASAAFATGTTTAAPPAGVDGCRAAFFHGEYESALAGLDAILDEDGKNVAALALKADVLAETGRDLEALAMVDAALKEQPDAAELHAVRAGLLAVVGKYDEAENAYGAALAKDGDNLRARVELARLMRLLERPDQLYEETGWFFDYYAEHDMDTPEEMVAVGVGAALGDAPQDGVSQCAKAEKADPDYLPCYLAMAEIFMEKRQHEDALREVRAARERNPKHPGALVMLASLRMAKRDLGPATRMCERALEINPRCLDAHTLLAAIAWIDEYEDVALDHLDRCFAVNPEYPPARRLRAAFMYLLDRTEAFDAEVKRIRTVCRNDAAIWRDLADLLSMNHRLDAAETYYRKALEADPDDSESLAGLGITLMRAAREDEALEYLTKSLRLDPFNNVRVYNLKLLLKRDEEYAEKESGLFSVRLHESDEAVLRPRIGAAADRHMREMSALYGHMPEERIVLQVMKSQPDFAARVTGLPHLDANGVCFGPMVLLVSPRPWLRMGRPFNWSDVLRHEIAHVATLRGSAFRIPRWLTEGMSVHAQKVIDVEWDPPLKTAVVEEMFPRLERFNSWFNRPKTGWQVPAGYNMAGLFVRWFTEDYGAEQLPKLVELYRRKASTAEAFAAVTGGKSLDELEATWRRRLREYAESIQCRAIRSPKEFEEVEKRAEEHPDDVLAQADYMDICMQAGRQPVGLGIAEDLYGKLLDLADEDALPDGELGRAYHAAAVLHGTGLFYKKEYEDATRAFTLATTLRPNHYAGHLWLGHLASREKKWKEAIPHFEKAVECYPRYVGQMNAYQGLVEAQRKASMVPEATQTLERYCEINIADPGALVELAGLYAQRNWTVKQRGALERLLDVDPYNAGAWKDLAAIHALDGDKDAAAACEKVAVSLEAKETSKDDDDAESRTPGGIPENELEFEDDDW